MLDFRNFFKNHFDSDRISDNELSKFSEDHLARITANNTGGILNPIIAATGAKHIAYFGAISNEDVAAAVKEGTTAATHQQLEACKKLVQHREAAIRAAFPKDEPGYQEFFPHGLTEYSRMNLETAALLMHRIATAVAAHSAVLGAPLAAEFKEAMVTFQNLRDAQLGRKGAVSNLKETAADSRTALELQLIANMCFIGYNWPGDVERCLAYFDQSILRD